MAPIARVLSLREMSITSRTDSQQLSRRSMRPAKALSIAGKAAQGLRGRLKRALPLKKASLKRFTKGEIETRQASNDGEFLSTRKDKEHQEIMIKFQQAVYKIQRESKGSPKSPMIRTPKNSSCSEGSSSGSTLGSCASPSGRDVGIDDSARNLNSNEMLKPKLSNLSEDNGQIFFGGSMGQPNQKGILKKITTKQTSAARDRLRRRTTTGSMDRTRSKEKETESESPKRCFSRSEPECQIGEDESVSSGSSESNRCGRRPTEAITAVVLEQKTEVLQAVSLAKDQIRLVKRQIDFLNSQLQAMKTSPRADHQFISAVDDLDKVLMSYKKLRHQLEELEDEREMLKRKVLASRSASEACKGFEVHSMGIPDFGKERDHEALIKLAYAGLLKEHD